MSDKFDALTSTVKKPIAKGISIRMLRGKGAKAELAVIVGDDATAEELRKAWPTIDRLRSQMRRVQGSPMNRIDNALIFGYVVMRIRGKWSYEFIAQDINFDVICNLVTVIHELPAKAAAESHESYGAAYHLLRVMRMKEGDIKSWLTAGLEDIKNGQAPWSVDRGPVTAARVREALRQFERDLESGKIVVKEAPKTEMINLSEISEKNDHITSKAVALLKHSYPKTYKRLSDYALKKVRESVRLHPLIAGKTG